MHGDADGLEMATRDGIRAAVRRGFHACARCVDVATAATAPPGARLSVWRSLCLGCGRVYHVDARERCGSRGGPLETSHGVCPVCDAQLEVEQQARDLVAHAARLEGVSTSAVVAALAALDDARRGALDTQHRRGSIVIPRRKTRGTK